MTISTQSPCSIFPSCLMTSMTWKLAFLFIFRLVVSLSHVYWAHLIRFWRKGNSMDHCVTKTLQLARQFKTTGQPVEKQELRITPWCSLALFCLSCSFAIVQTDFLFFLQTEAFVYLLICDKMTVECVKKTWLVVYAPPTKHVSSSPGTVDSWGLNTHTQTQFQPNSFTGNSLRSEWFLRITSQICWHIHDLRQAPSLHFTFTLQL